MGVLFKLIIVIQIQLSTFKIREHIFSLERALKAQRVRLYERIPSDRTKFSSCSAVAYINLTVPPPLVRILSHSIVPGVTYGKTDKVYYAL